MAEPFSLTADERLVMARDGFVLRHDVFSQAEVSEMADAVEALERELLALKRHTKVALGSYMFERQKDMEAIVKWEPQNPDVVQGIEPFAHISPELKEWAHDARLWNPSRDWVGENEINLFTEKVTMKRAHTGGTIILHQDYPYWEPHNKDAKRVVTAMIQLDDATVENGCLEVAPGSHTGGKYPGKVNTDGFGTLEMDETQFDLSRMKPVESKAGSVIFFGPFLVHRSLPNRSDKQRRALLFSYQPAGNPTSVETTRQLIAEAKAARAAAQA